MTEGELGPPCVEEDGESAKPVRFECPMYTNIQNLGGGQVRPALGLDREKLLRRGVGPLLLRELSRKPIMSH